MMRKTVGIFLGLILSASVGYALETEGDFIEVLFDEAGVDQNFDSDPGAIEDLSLADDPFKDLYLFMYQNVVLYPREKAIEQAALRTGYTEEQMSLMILNGDFTPIFDSYEAEGLSPDLESVGKEYSFIQELFDDEFKFQVDNYTLSYEAMAQELFMNGDTSDSANIDLLFDLDVIHYLLFGEYVVPEDRTADSEVFLSSEDSAESDEDIILSAEEDDEPEIAAPLVCTEDEALRESLEDFEEYLQSLPEDEAEILSGGITVEDLEEELTDDAGASTTDDNEGRNPVEGPDLNDFLSTIEGSPGLWSRGLPCDMEGPVAFCITLNLVTEQDDETQAEDDFEPEENCIACHTSYILERMEETLDQSLVPGKVSMNWFEDATCKEAGNQVNLDLQVYTVRKPIYLDPSDDLDESAAENIEDLKATLFAFGENPSSRINPGKNKDEIDFENLAYFQCDGDQDECIEAALERQQLREENIENAYQEFVLASQGENSLALYEQLAAELVHFGTYMDSFQTSLRETYLTGNAPLSKLTNKSYCQ